MSSQKHPFFRVSERIVTTAFQEAQDELFPEEESDLGSSVDQEGRAQDISEIDLTEETSGCPPEFQTMLNNQSVSLIDFIHIIDTLNNNKEFLQAETGQTVRLKTSVSGFPQPEITWFFNGIEVLESK